MASCGGSDGEADGDGGNNHPPAGMALIPAGCFNMGDSFSEGQSDELPVHDVCLTADFYLDVQLVTNAEYRTCADAAGCVPPEYANSFSRAAYYGNPAYDDFPVIYVSWDQAVAFCAGEGKRLPTEAEWEYAARGGLAGRRYLSGDTISGTDANYGDSGDPWDNDTSPTGFYAPNGYGLYDMAGNVWEWVSDHYSPTYYSQSPVDDPTGPDTGSSRVVRGGCWSMEAINLRVSNRLNFVPTQIGSPLGFRCARD